MLLLLLLLFVFFVSNSDIRKVNNTLNIFPFDQSHLRKRTRAKVCETDNEVISQHALKIRH